MGLAQEFAAMRLLQPEENESTLELHLLPPDALALIMEKLSLEEIARCCQASSLLRTALKDDRIWYGQTIASWGKVTAPAKWLTDAPGLSSPSSSQGLPAPSTYRQLYTLLKTSAPIIGLWRLVGEGPRSALIRFEWEEDGIKGTEVVPEMPLTGKAGTTFFARLCPAHGLTTSVSVEADSAVVTVHAADNGIHKSPSAEQAASASQSTLGTSPQGSFEQEWLTFMSTNIKQRSKQRRRSQRGMAGHPGGPTFYHLKRVHQLSAPSSRLSLGGLWVADYGQDFGLEILQLQYSYSGPKAQLRAVKVTGDECVPAGQVSWHCATAALPVPWTPADQQLVAAVQLHEERRLEELEGLAEEQQEEEGGEEAAAQGRRTVVAVHAGQGQIAAVGFLSPEWVAGRLVVIEGDLDPQSLCFAWGEHVIAMRRLRLNC